jgi:2-polyprenyl-3-methyl-5-hydroxy-6-metoxy-1,4-benzoquinol methylase
VNPTFRGYRYYGYRLADAFDEDPRLRAFDAAWFAGRKVLDIGCNEGVLTLSLACKFGCKDTLGVDIDGALIGKASRALKSLRGQLTQQLRTPALGCVAAPQSCLYRCAACLF